MVAGVWGLGLEVIFPALFVARWVVLVMMVNGVIGNAIGAKIA